LEEAVFALKEGEVSDVVEGPGGFHVFIANQVEAEKGETFEEAREQVESEVRRQLAAERFAEMATRLTDLVYDNPSSLEPAAQELGLALRTVSGVTRDGLLGVEDVGDQAAAASPDAMIFEDPRVRSTLFSSSLLNEKANSGVIEITPDTLAVVRVANFEPAHVPAIDQVKGRVESILTAQAARAAAAEAGEQALAALRQNAADEGVEENFGTPMTVSRIDNQGLAKPVLDAVFAVDGQALPAYVGVTGPQGYVVAKVEEVKAGEDNTMLAEGLSIELSRSWGMAEQRAVLMEMRNRLGVARTADAEEVLSGESS